MNTFGLRALVDLARDGRGAGMTTTALLGSLLGAMALGLPIAFFRTSPTPADLARAVPNFKTGCLYAAHWDEPIFPSPDKVAEPTGTTTPSATPPSGCTPAWAAWARPTR